MHKKTLSPLLNLVNLCLLLKTDYNLVPEELNWKPHLSVLLRKTHSCVMA